MPSNREPYEVGAVEVISVSDRALCVRSPEHEKPMWIPFSQIVEDASEITPSSEKGEAGNLVVTQWLAEERGWV